MAMIHVSENPENNVVTISIRDRFDFSAHKEFRASYNGRSEVSCYVINMKDVNYIDSSALGMLLLLREHAGAKHGRVVIANCNPDIMKILAIANFDRLFEIQ